MANRWGNNGNGNRLCWAPKSLWMVTAAMKLRRLLLGGKTMTNLNSILKSKEITLRTKVHIVKAMVFPVVMYKWESWTKKKVDCQRIDAFKLWCWKRLLRVPWKARRSNQSILKEINPEYSLEGLMLKLKLQNLAIWCEKPTHWKRLWCRERLRAEEEGKRMRWLDVITNSVDMNLSKLQEIVKDKEVWHAVVHAVTKSQTQFSDWTTTQFSNESRANSSIYCTRTIHKSVWCSDSSRTWVPFLGESPCLTVPHLLHAHPKTSLGLWGDCKRLAKL